MTSESERNRAVERLVREEDGRIRRVLSSLRVPSSHREDLLQTGLLLLLQRWDSVDDPLAWLLGALRNLHRSQVRDEGRRGRLAEATARFAPPPTDTARSRDSEIRIDLARWLLALPRAQRILVVGLFLLEDPLESVARRVGVKPASVQTLKSRSLDRLRRMAQRNGGVRPP